MNTSTGSLSTGTIRLREGDEIQIEGEGKARRVTHVMGSDARGWHACFARQGGVPQGKLRWRVTREVGSAESASAPSKWKPIAVTGALRSATPVIITGFDSAWTRSNRGALASFAIEGGGVRTLIEPQPVAFDEAAQRIEQAERAAGDASVHLIMVDQPLIVPNEQGRRPVERVLYRVMGRAGGGVQPANRSRLAMFGDGAPLWELLEGLQGELDPWAVHRGGEGRIVIEAFPALAVLGLFPELHARRRAPKYNPDRKKTFSIDDWRGLCLSLAAIFRRLKVKDAERWCGAAARRAPRKSDQDALDALICVLVGMAWWAAPESVVVVGDLEHGYVVAPAHAALREEIAQCGVAEEVPVSVGPVRRSAAAAGTPSAVLAAVDAPSAASGDDVDILVRHIAEGRRAARYESVLR